MDKKNIIIIDYCFGYMTNYVFEISNAYFGFFFAGGSSAGGAVSENFDIFN